MGCGGTQPASKQHQMSHISLGTTCMILPAMMNSQGFGAELFS